MTVEAPHRAKLIANVAILTPDRALLVKYAAGHDGDQGWMLADDLLAQGEHPDEAAARVLQQHLAITATPKLAFVDSFTGGDGTWHVVFNYSAEFTHAPPIKPADDVAGTGWFMLANLPADDAMGHHGWARGVLDRIVAARGKG